MPHEMTIRRKKEQRIRSATTLKSLRDDIRDRINKRLKKNSAKADKKKQKKTKQNKTKKTDEEREGSKKIRENPPLDKSPLR